MNICFWFTEQMTLQLGQKIKHRKIGRYENLLVDLHGFDAENAGNLMKMMCQWYLFDVIMPGQLIYTYINYTCIRRSQMLNLLL